MALDSPKVMGILNVTPDSFYDGGKHANTDAALRHCEAMLKEGAAIVDVGGMSSRPGAVLLDEASEMERVMPVVRAISKEFPDAIISIDTVCSRVARACVGEGAAMVNDISAGRFDSRMYSTVAELGVPYALMHIQGTPGNMQQAPHYEDVVREILDFFIAEVAKLTAAGVKDVLIDPGFGFGKTVVHNYELLNGVHAFRLLERPIMVGISRKSMICRVLDVAPKDALNGTSALHIVALQQGARILRVHDVKEAVEVIRLWQQLPAVMHENIC